MTGEFLAQRASSAENVSIWGRHHGIETKVQFKIPILHINRKAQTILLCTNIMFFTLMYIDMANRWTCLTKTGLGFNVSYAYPFSSNLWNDWFFGILYKIESVMMGPYRNTHFSTLIWITLCECIPIRATFSISSRYSLSRKTSYRHSQSQYREMLKPRDISFEEYHRSEIWQASRQKCCRNASQMSER